MTTQATTPPGATLYLGGNAWAHPDLVDQLVAIAGEPTLHEGLRDDPDASFPPLTPYPGNPRRGDQDAITASIRDLGLYRAVIVQRHSGYVLAGNHTLRALIDLGAEHVPVTWVEVDDTRAAAIVARDNRTSDQGSYDDAELLALLTSEPEVLALSGYDDADLDLLRSLTDPPPPNEPGPYTRKAEPVQYEPTMETPPPPAELVDRTKANALVSRIVAADLPTEVRDFLIAGAQRHLVFNYAKVAEFYAHADADVQDLMEQSALVIVDFDDAIRHGYVQLTDRLGALLDQDQTEREALDSAGVNGA